MGLGELGLPHGEEVGKRDATVALAAEPLGVNKGVQLQYLCCQKAPSTHWLVHNTLDGLIWRFMAFLDKSRRLPISLARGRKGSFVIVSVDRLV